MLGDRVEQLQADLRVCHVHAHPGRGELGSATAQSPELRWRSPAEATLGLAVLSPIPAGGAGFGGGIRVAHSRLARVSSTLYPGPVLLLRPVHEGESPAGAHRWHAQPPRETAMRLPEGAREPGAGRRLRPGLGGRCLYSVLDWVCGPVSSPPVLFPILTATELLGWLPARPRPAARRPAARPPETHSPARMHYLAQRSQSPS